jgi:hypothetical protein
MYESYTQQETQPMTPAVSFPKTDHAPTIASSAILVELTIRTWAGRKKDKRATKEVNSQNNAAKGTANVTKKLLGECEELKAITNYAEVIRDYHRSSTLPWSKGAELLTNDYFLDYNRTMEQMFEHFNDLVEAFIAAYNWEKQVAQTQLGKMYDPDEYPTADSLRSKFGISFGYMPVPDRGDFRVDINAAAKEVLEEAHRKYYDDKVATMTNGICERIIQPLQLLVERIDFGAGDKAKKIYETTVQHAHDLLDILKVCNVIKDPKIEAVRLDIARALEGVTTDGLRNSHHLRAKTKRNVEDIIKNLPSLGF